MIQRWELDDRPAFLARLEALRAQGVPPERIRVRTPVPGHEAEALLRVRQSPLRYFTLAGACAGLLLGFAFPILTVRSWPLITGGKPLVSVPAFIVVAFALTILLGALASFFGFLLLARLPSPARIREPEEHADAFVIEVSPEDAGGGTNGGDGARPPLAPNGGGHA